jgi:hypothetical protein
LQKLGSADRYLMFKRQKIKISLALSDHSGRASTKQFHKTFVMANSIESLSRDSKGHVSVEHKSIGKHFVRIKAKTTSSEAARPILLTTAFNDGKNFDLDKSNEHLNERALSSLTPR